MKLKKLLSCLLALMLIICASGVMASAAETAVFSDSFERESETGFYVSNPVLRSYGENLFTNGDFSSNLIKSEGDGNAVYFSNGTSALSVEDEKLKAEVASGKITSTDSAFSINIPVDYMTAGNIYELEMYVKSASAYPIDMYLKKTHVGTVYDASKNSGGSYYGENFMHLNGNRMMYSVAAPEWERVVARFSINSDMAPTGTITEVLTHYDLLVDIDWDFDGRTETTDAVYIDNIKLRRVTNATPLLLRHRLVCLYIPM